jgi:hypothetical protein
MKGKQDYIFIDKSLFFPEQGILVIGDLHIGYEQALMDSGILIPEQQVNEVIETLDFIINEIKTKKYELKKIVFLGDIKHMFGYEWKEKASFNRILEFLKKYVSEKNIILIRGNHDTMNLGFQFKDYYIDSNIAFTHGFEDFPELYDKSVSVIVTGHLHPSVILTEDPGVKKENYKCFLVGSSKGKTILVLPSFLEFYEGTPINYYKEDFIPSFSIIPKKDILKFKIFVIGEDSVYEFGKVGDL